MHTTSEQQIIVDYKHEGTSWHISCCCKLIPQENEMHKCKTKKHFFAQTRADPLFALFATATLHNYWKTLYHIVTQIWVPHKQLRWREWMLLHRPKRPPLFPPSLSALGDDEMEPFWATAGLLHIAALLTWSNRPKRHTRAIQFENGARDREYQKWDMWGSYSYILGNYDFWVTSFQKKSMSVSVNTDDLEEDVCYHTSWKSNPQRKKRNIWSRSKNSYLPEHGYRLPHKPPGRY